MGGLCDTCTRVSSEKSLAQQLQHNGGAVMAEQIVAMIVGLSGSAGELAQLHTQLKQAIPSITGRQHYVLQTHLLEQLDPSVYSLGYLFLLDAQTKSGLAASGDQLFIDSTASFLLHSSATQIQMVPDMFAKLCRTFRDQVLAIGAPRIGINPLLAALRKLQPTREHLTPVHAEFFQLCLLAKMYNAATEVLLEDVYDVDPQKTAVTPTDFFLYCYYGGMLAAGRKQYGRALELLLQSLTAPAAVGNAIVVAAFKKLALVSLIHTGSMVQLPKFTSSRVRSVVESEGKAYLDLASAYCTHNADKLHRCVEQYSAAYTADTNMGLVRQVVASLVKRNIQRLTQTYMTLSLTDIASSVGLASAQEAELHVLRMIESGDVHAHINERDGMVRFLEDPEKYNNATTSTRMDDHIRQCIQVAGKMQAVHDAVLCDKHYLSKVSAKERSRFESQEEYGSSPFAPYQLFQP